MCVPRNTPTQSFAYVIFTSLSEGVVPLIDFRFQPWLLRPVSESGLENADDLSFHSQAVQLS